MQLHAGFIADAPEVAFPGQQPAADRTEEGACKVPTEMEDDSPPVIAVRQPKMFTDPFREFS